MENIFPPPMGALLLVSFMGHFRKSFVRGSLMENLKYLIFPQVCSIIRLFNRSLS